MTCRSWSIFPIAAYVGALAFAPAAGLVGAVPDALAQAVDTVKVTPASAERTVTLPGELLPFETVNIVARVQGYIDTFPVDRGAQVRRGQVLATLVAPELAAQVAEAQARVEAANARRAESEAQLATMRATYERLRTASATAGAVAGIELLRAEESLKAAQALVDANARAVDAARASLDAVRTLEGYLKVVAPFAGRVTERSLHPGALAGPSTGPLLRLEQTARLRLVVYVPEQQYAGAATGRALSFTVPAHPGRTFTGKLARLAGALDPKTRAMAVELDVDNADGALAPGMFPDVTWPVTAARGTWLVPATAVVTTTERSFVIRVAGGKAEWVDVKKGATRGEQVEVRGNLADGDVVLKRGTDEIVNGATVATK